MTTTDYKSVEGARSIILGASMIHEGVCVVWKNQEIRDKSTFQTNKEKQSHYRYVWLMRVKEFSGKIIIFLLYT